MLRKWEACGSPVPSTWRPRWDDDDRATYRVNKGIDDASHDGPGGCGPAMARENDVGHTQVVGRAHESILDRSLQDLPVGLGRQTASQHVQICPCDFTIHIVPSI